MKYFKPNVVISRCVGFDHCRYDTSMITSPVVEKMKEHVNFITLCPEMAIGLPSPREAIRLAMNQGEINLIHSVSGGDVTQRMVDYVEKKVTDFNALSIEERVDGFILKSRSPSCGIKDVKIYSGPGKVQAVTTKGVGMFANGMMEAFPLSAFEDEGRLHSFNLREHFFTRLYVHAEFRNLRLHGTMKDLIAFHSRNKYLFMSFNQSVLKQMGSLVANHAHLELNEVLDKYSDALLHLLGTPASMKRQVNMLQHVFGYFSKDLNQKEKAYFLEMLYSFQQEQVPMSVLLSTLETWTLRFEQPYLLEQSVFRPFPKELLLPIDSKYQKY
jgi:uncharacterized protein YbgA (DUF1722 family)/uncharacterized protein YbbK (DUF523 family)